jgi:hypothetical protein
VQIWLRSNAAVEEEQDMETEDENTKMEDEGDS